MTISPQGTPRGDMSAFAEIYPHEDIFMQQARNNGAEVGAIDPSPAVCALLKFITYSVRAKSVVEIGTGSGVSGLWIFQGLPTDGTFTSIDTEREHSGIARKVFEESGISAQRFRLITGNVIDVVGKLADKNYDLMVVRPAQDLFDVVQESYRLLSPRGTLIIDEVLSGGKVADPTQRDFDSISRRDVVRAIKEDLRWHSSLLPVGAGVLVATKVG
ncbi:MAG: O-methyltransferase [Actinomycetes bacterium]